MGWRGRGIRWGLGGGCCRKEAARPEVTPGQVKSVCWRGVSLAVRWVSQVWTPRLTGSGGSPDPAGPTLGSKSPSFPTEKTPGAGGKCCAVGIRAGLQDWSAGGL